MYANPFQQVTFVDEQSFKDKCISISTIHLHDEFLISPLIKETKTDWDQFPLPHQKVSWNTLSYSLKYVLL
jgi:hypothetical protein